MLVLSDSSTWVTNLLTYFCLTAGLFSLSVLYLLPVLIVLLTIWLLNPAIVGHVVA
jgi:hypothetical protein